MTQVLLQLNPGTYKVRRCQRGISYPALSAEGGWFAMQLHLMTIGVRPFLAESPQAGARIFRQVPSFLVSLSLLSHGGTYKSPSYHSHGKHINAGT